MRIKVIFIILVFVSLLSLVSCKIASNTINSPTDAKQENISMPTKTPEAATSIPIKVLEASNSIEIKDVIETTDMDKWEHPIKSLFNDTGLIKVEFLKQKTYPVFYVKQNTVNDQEIINNYLSGKYSSMLKENGYWDFEIKTMDNKAIKISGSKETKEIKAIMFENKTLSIEKYKKEVQMIMEALTSRLVKKDELSSYYYFRSPFNQNKRPIADEDFYYLSPFKYELQKNLYIILFGRKTDTKAVYYHAEIKENKAVLYYQIDGNEVAVNDFNEVYNLFVSRYLISDKNKEYYALKQSPNEFIYRVFVDDFDYSNKLYHLRLSRSTDTAQNFFLYNAENDKFYRDGLRPDEIKSQYDVFVWVP